MLLGIGYLPRRTGPALWREYDPGEVQEDLAHIAALGFQAVRVPLFWGDFQPRLESISPRALDRFGGFLETAHDVGLQVTAGLWTGMWDGALWWPDWGVLPAPLPPNWPLLVNGAWARWGRLRHPFTDQRMLAARQLLIRELVAAYADHPALLGWEPLPGFGRLAAASTREAVLAWLQATLEALCAAAKERTCTFLLALDALETSTSIWPDDILAAGAQPSLSAATFASDRRRLPLNARWIAFALDLAAALAGQPVALHLAGLPTTAPGETSTAHDGIYYASEEDAAAYLADVIALARQRGCPALWLWRWADIAETGWNKPPYDHSPWRRFTGLLRADGVEKRLVQGLQSGSGREHPVFAIDAAAYRADPGVQFYRLWLAYQKLDDRAFRP